MFKKNKPSNTNNETKEKKPMSKGKKIAIGIAVLFVLAVIGSGGNDNNSKTVTNNEQNKQQTVDDSVQASNDGAKEKPKRNINDLPAPTVELTNEEFIEVLGTFFADYNAWQKELLDNIDTYDSITAAEDFLQTHFDKIPAIADEMLTLKTPEEENLHFAWVSAYNMAFQSLLAYDEIQALLSVDSEEDKNQHLQQCNYILTTVMAGYVDDVQYYLGEYAKEHQ